MRIDRRAFVMKMFWIALAILAIAMSIWGATRPAAAEEFPVWWSPKLEVESLGKVARQLTDPGPGPGRSARRRLPV